MRTWPNEKLADKLTDKLAENLDILLERDPYLAGLVMAHPVYASVRAGNPPPPFPADGPELHANMVRMARDSTSARTLVLLGLGDSVATLRAHSDAMVLIVEPSIDHLMAYLCHHSVLPLVLNARALIATSPEAVVSNVVGFGVLTLVRHPARCADSNLYFRDLEQVLRVRAAHVRAMHVRNQPETLLKQIPSDSALATFLETLPPGKPVLLPDVLEELQRRPKKWGKVERLFATMECFK